MKIDLTNLIIGNQEKITIDEIVSIPDSKLNDTTIKELKNVTFTGSITKLYNDEYEIKGNITGIMVLPDDITLENIDYSFTSEIEEKFTGNSDTEEKSLEIEKNILDISEFLWQNILVEIPLKVINDKNKNLTLKGNGWRLITEEELEKEKSNDSPFNELYNLIDSRKE